MSGRPRVSNRQHLPRWLYVDKWGTYYYRGPKRDGSGRVYIQIGKDITEARAMYGKLTSSFERPVNMTPLTRAQHRDGYVYVLRAGEQGPLKIGFSGTPNGVQQRISELQTGCPFPVKLVGYCAGSTELEHRMHIKLNRWRSNGEWFHPTGPVLIWAAIMLKHPDLLCQFFL